MLGRMTLAAHYADRPEWATDQNIDMVEDGQLFVPRNARSRAPDPMRLLFVENFKAPVNGMWNDGLGCAARDTDIWFAGAPTVRLDTCGVAASGSPTNPGRTAITTGVVFKRRIQDGFSGAFGLEGWFRFTASTTVTNTFLSMSVYNRDGTNAYHGRVWLDPAGNNTPMHGKILDGAATAAAGGTATYFDAVTSVLQNGGGSHTYDLGAANGRGDKAGGWHYVKLVVDFVTKRYVSLTLDGQPPVDLRDYQLDVTATTGAAMMHFSWEFCGTTTTRRYVNIAQVQGYGK